MNDNDNGIDTSYKNVQYIEKVDYVSCSVVAVDQIAILYSFKAKKCFIN